jgi:hypothetical protein
VFLLAVSDAAAALRYMRCPEDQEDRIAKTVYHTSSWNPGRTLYWLNSEDTHPGSLIWLCEIFGTEPETIRAYVNKNWRTL